MVSVMNATHPIFFAETADETAHFLHQGVDPDITTGLGKTPLCFARTPEQALLLISAGADVNGNDLTTPLHHVTDLEVMRTLISAGADVNKADKFNETPIFTAGSKARAQLLIEHGARWDVFNLFKTSPLHYLDDLELAKYFVELGADVNCHVDKSPYPMETITNPEVLKFYLDRGGVIPHRKKGELFNRDTTTEQMILYLQAGANPNMINREGKTALTYAKDIKAAQLLLDHHGADINKTDAFGKTPLFHIKDKDLLNFYLERPELKKVFSDRQGRNPLHTQHDPEILYALAWSGIDVNQQDEHGNTPLHYHMDSVDAMRCLLICGADPNIANHDGITPLAMCDSKSVLALLYYSGVDLSNLDSQGKSAWDNGDDAIKKFIDAKKISMPIFNNFSAPQQVDSSPEKNIPPDLLETMKAGDWDYFDAMLDIYANAAMMKDIFHHLLNERNYRFCKLLLENKKIPSEEQNNLRALLKRQQLTPPVKELLDLTGRM